MLSHQQYLTFELNATCNMANEHPRCPTSDPERFKFGKTERKLTDAIVLSFWRWAYYHHGFRGVVLWHLYNEPTLVKTRISALLKQMHAEAPEQRSHLWTNSPNAVKLVGFQHVQLTDYRVVRPDDLDNRRASTSGEGRPYSFVKPSGRCGRGFGWELILDAHGNWLLCCNDWQNEASIGNVFTDDWEVLLRRYAQAEIGWHDKASYDRLPRLCRSCMTVNPGLHRSARMPKWI